MEENTQNPVGSDITFIPHFPTAPLTEFVELFWYVEGHVPYRREKILPTEYIELIFNLGRPYKIFPDEHSPHFAWNKTHWLCGIQTRYIINEAPDHSELLGIRFKPGGLFPFLGFPVSELKDQIIELELIWGSWIQTIHEQLLATTTLPARFAILQATLQQKLTRHTDGWTAVQHATRRILQARQPITIQTLSNEIGWSQKHLIQQCKKMIGVSPKLLARINRFHRMLHTVDPSHPVNWTEIAHQWHYYDQSHFNRDFQAFSGQTPSQYLHLRQTLLPTPVSQGESVQFVPIA